MSAVDSKVRWIIADHLCVDPKLVTPEAEIRGDVLDADSLEAIDLMMAIEEEFALVIDDQIADKLITVGDVIAHVEKYSPVKR